MRSLRPWTGSPWPRSIWSCGEGDVLGAAQAGVRSSLKLLRVVKDAALITRARELAEGILSDDPELARHPVSATPSVAA